MISKRLQCAAALVWQPIGSIEQPAERRHSERRVCHLDTAVRVSCVGCQTVFAISPTLRFVTLYGRHQVVGLGRQSTHGPIPVDMGRSACAYVRTQRKGGSPYRAVSPLPWQSTRLCLNNRVCGAIDVHKLAQTANAVGQPPGEWPAERDGDALPGAAVPRRPRQSTRRHHTVVADPATNPRVRAVRQCRSCACIVVRVCTHVCTPGCQESVLVASTCYVYPTHSHPHVHDRPGQYR